MLLAASCGRIAAGTINVRRASETPAANEAAHVSRFARAPVDHVDPHLAINVDAHCVQPWPEAATESEERVVVVIIRVRLGHSGRGCLLV